MRTLLPKSWLICVVILAIGCNPDFPDSKPTELRAVDASEMAQPPNTSGQTDSSIVDPQHDAMTPDGSETDAALPSPEDLCDGQDNDRDNQIDEGFEIGQPCDTGRPGCSLDGLFACDLDGGRQCQRRDPPIQVEQCNALDDDCDGIVDEGINGVGEECVNGLGSCQAEGFRRCNPEGQLICDASPNRPTIESCNFIDDDCDGHVDEDLRLTEPCTVGNGICVARGEFICGENGRVVCSAVSPVGIEETCDGIDNDCDGPIDEDRACGPYIESHCRIYIGWADRREGPIGQGDVNVSDSFGNCPESNDDGAFREHCESTRQDGLMRRLLLPDSHAFNHDDLLSVAFQCNDEANPALSRWIERRCQVSLGYVTEDPPVVGQESWGTCPGADGVDGRFRCVRSGGDRRFHTMVASDRNVDVGGAFAVAFTCRDDDVNRATAVQSSVQVTFALGMRYLDDVRDGAETWPNCTERDLVDASEAMCARTLGFGQYIPMPVGRRLRSYLGRNDRFAFGIGLRALPRE